MEGQEEPARINTKRREKQGPEALQRKEESSWEAGYSLRKDPNLEENDPYSWKTKDSTENNSKGYQVMEALAQSYHLSVCSIFIAQGSENGLFPEALYICEVNESVGL